MSDRVFGGFALLVLFAGIIFIVAMVGIKQIGDGVSRVAERSMPTLVAGSDLSISILEAELKLKQLASSDKKEQARAIRKSLDKALNDNRDAISSLNHYVQLQPHFEQLFVKTSKLNQQFIELSNSAVIEHLRVLDLMETVELRASEFGDMGDESLSFAYDLEGLSENEILSNTISEFVNLIESMVDEANAALDSKILFEVLSAQSSLASSQEELNRLFASIVNAQELSGNDAIGVMEQNLAEFNRALLGEQSAIKAKLDGIKRVEKSLQQLNLAQQRGGETRQLLSQLNEQIEQSTDQVKQEALESVTQNQWVTSILALITFSLSIGIAYFVALSIRKPLHNAVSQIKQAAQGDMTVTFTKMRDDELGELADNMQVLVNMLRSTLKEVSNNSQSLATTAEQTNTIAQQSFDSVSAQSEQMQAMNSSILEMKETVNSVTGSVHQTLEEVEQANNDANRGEALLLENVENIGVLADAIEASAKVIEQLNEDTNNISSVLDVIRGVAEQTNLLALNAAIEAARAGEQGRGFAVVADEVRTLASRAHDSTQEIQQAIERLQIGAKEAVDTMAKSQQETHDCVNGIQDVKDMLGSIVAGIASIRDMSQQIATASEQQSIAAQSQYQNVVQIQEITDLSAEHAQENKQASQQLAEMAETQRELMNKFKT